MFTGASCTQNTSELAICFSRLKIHTSANRVVAVPLVVLELSLKNRERFTDRLSTIQNNNNNNNNNNNKKSNQFTKWSTNLASLPWIKLCQLASHQGKVTSLYWENQHYSVSLFEMSPVDFSPVMTGPGQCSSIPFVHFSQIVFWEMPQWSGKETNVKYITTKQNEWTCRLAILQTWSYCIESKQIKHWVGIRYIHAL